MMKKEILYQYTIKTDGVTTELVEIRNRLPIAKAYGVSEKTNAELLRDLAKWVIEQAEIIEELDGFSPMPQREPFGYYH